MNHATSILLRASALLVVFALSFANAAPASAGCLSEYGDCGDCAKQALRDAFWEGDLEDFMDAYVDGIDCDIDLAHCLLYGHHHDYSCGV